MGLYLGGKDVTEVFTDKVMLADPQTRGDGPYLTQSDANKYFLGATNALQDQIDSIVVGTAKGEWLVQVGGSNPADGVMVINDTDWSSVDMMWFSLTDNDGFFHHFHTLLSVGDRIRVTQGQSFGTYRITDVDETRPGFTRVAPMLSGLAGTAVAGELASVQIEDLDSSGGGAGGLVPPLAWGDLLFGAGNYTDEGAVAEPSGEVDRNLALVPPVTWGELIGI